ncbi:MAG TPA: DUF4410 domain-containing protein [Terriglobales bacterium]|nr:DUF4410 domain-containing protein [Terriglobales bacterium]
MRSRKSVAVVAVVSLLLVAGAVAAENANKVLAGVKTVQVDATLVPNPSKVKEDHAPNQVMDSLKRALRDADFEIGESPIRAHLVLDEFTSGSMAKRFMVGFGAGRSTVDCRLVLQDAEGKELFNKRIRVRGNLVWSPYQGGNTQRRQAVNSFEQRLLEEIEGLK